VRHDVLGAIVPVTDRQIARLLVVLGLAVQIGVPARQLFRPRQARFGWQMFSNPTPRPVVIAIRAAGARDTLRVDDYFAFRRGDLNPSYIERLPPHLCRVIPELEGVVIRRGVTAPAVVHRCR
jgi:hypothetical protein